MITCFLSFLFSFLFVFFSISIFLFAREGGEREGERPDSYWELRTFPFPFVLLHYFFGEILSIWMGFYLIFFWHAYEIPFHLHSIISGLRIYPVQLSNESYSIPTSKPAFSIHTLLPFLYLLLLFHLIILYFLSYRTFWLTKFSISHSRSFHFTFVYASTHLLGRRI